MLRYTEHMPVALAQKVRTLSADFQSSARLADLLGVLNIVGGDVLDA